MSRIVCLILFSLMTFAANRPVFAESGGLQNFAFQGEVLYWQARGSNLNYISNYQSLFILHALKSPVFLENLNITRESMQYDRDVGGRVSLIYHSPYEEELQGAIRWTYFSTNAYGKPHVCPIGFERGFKKVEYLESANWRLILNFWDFEVTKEIVADPCLTIDAYAGVRGTVLRQTYTSNGQFEFKVPPPSTSFAFVNEEDDFVVVSPSVNVNVPSFTNNSALIEIDELHRFYGAGPRVGLNAFWDLGYGFCLYGDLAGSYLVGFSRHTVCDDVLMTFEGNNVRSTKAAPVPNEITNQTLWERQETLQSNRGIVDLSAGIAWSPSWRKLCCPWVFRLGFENHTIFGQKHAYFGQDAIPMVIDQAAPVGSFPQATGPCKSTLSVYGVVFSASYTY